MQKDEDRVKNALAKCNEWFIKNEPKSKRRFQFFNWLSGLLWVSVVISFGYALSMIPFVKRHEDQVMTFLMILPIALLTAGLLGTLFVVIKKKYCNA